MIEYLEIDLYTDIKIWVTPSRQLDLQDVHRLYACQVQQRASRIDAACVLGRSAGINYRHGYLKKTERMAQ